MTKGKTIDFVSNRQRVLEKRGGEQLERELRERNYEDYKIKFEEIFNYWGLERAFFWLYEQLQAAAGIIPYDEVIPDPPCSDEEREKQRRAFEEMPDEGISVSELLNQF